MPTYKDKQRGTWFVKISTKDAVTGKRKQILKRGFETKRDAEKWEAHKILETGGQTSLSFRDMADRYFAYRNAKESTRRDQSAMIDRYDAEFIDLPIDKITKPMMMEWYLKLVGLDLQPGTKNLILQVTKSVFKHGADHYDLPHPAKALKRFYDPPKEHDTWTPKEFNQFIQFVELDTYRAFFTFLYWTGCRKGEARGLQYDSFKGDHVHIYRQMTVRGLSDLKTPSSIRTLKLPDTLRGDLRPFLERCDEDRPFVFGGDSCLSISTIQWQFKHAVKLSGVKPIRIHDLRHSFATNMIGSGANIVAVSRYLGHSSINITLKTYTHLLEKANDEMVSKLDSMMKS